VSFFADVYPSLLLSLLAAWVAAAVSTLPLWRRRLGDAGVLAAIVLAALAACPRLCQPRAHRVYYDEFEHLDAARNIADYGRWGETILGGLPGRSLLARPTWPGGHHAELALIWRVFGGGQAVAFDLNVLMSSGAAFWLVAAAACALGLRAGLLAGGSWAALALSWRWAATADLCTPAAFWAAASLAGLALERAEDSAAARAFAGLSLAYAIQVRFENALLLPFAWAVWRGPRRALLLPTLAFAFPATLAVLNARQALPGFSEGPAAALAALREHLPANLVALAALPGVLLLVPGLAAASLRREGREWLALAVAYLLVYSAFFRGRFDCQERYALGVLLPLLPAAAAGWDLLLPPAPAAALALLAPFLALNAAAPDVPPLAGPAASEELLRSASVAIPARAYVLTFTPSAVRVAAGRPAAEVYYVLEDRARFERERAEDGAAPELALWKDWAWRGKGAETRNLEAWLSDRYETRSVARVGDDEFVILSPR